MNQNKHHVCISETIKSLLEGKLKSDELPLKIDLSAVATDMGNLWKQSIRDIEQGVVYECAGTIVLDINGNLKFVNPMEKNTYPLFKVVRMFLLL